MTDTPPTLVAFRTEARHWLASAAKQFEVSESEAVATRVDVARGMQRALFDNGLAGISWPSEYGGRGLSLAHEVVWAEESAHYALPTELLMCGLALVGPALLEIGTIEQQERFVRPILRGDHLWCQLLSEPDAGSDLASLTTQAVGVDDGFVVNGQKVWNSLAHLCDFGILLARTAPGGPTHSSLTMLVVDMTAPGVDARPLRQITGAAEFSEVFLHDVHLSRDAVIGTVDGGWPVVGLVLGNERASLASGPAMRDASSHGVLRLFDRLRLDVVARHHVAQLYTTAKLLELDVRRGQRRLADGISIGPQASLGKLTVSRFVRRRAALRVEMGGAGAVAWEPGTDGDQLALQLLHAPARSIGGGTDEIQLNIIGERILGLPREQRVEAHRRADGA